MRNSRAIALELVENGLVSVEDLLTMALKYMRNDDVEDMLDSNELSERFFEDDEPDVDYLTELYDAFGEDC